MITSEQKKIEDYIKHKLYAFLGKLLKDINNYMIIKSCIEI